MNKNPEEVKKKVDSYYNRLSDEEKNEIYEKQKRQSMITTISLSVVSTILAIVCIVAGVIGSSENRQGMIVVAIILFVVVGYLIYKHIFILKNKEKTIKSYLKKEKLEDIYLENFVVDKEIVLNSQVSKFARLLIDSKNGQFVYEEDGVFSKAVKFKDIRSYEIYENGDSVVKGTSGRALIGGMFFGLSGVLIGGMASRKTRNICTNLKLLVKINDLDCPVLDIPFIDEDTQKQTSKYKDCVESLQEICAYFEYMINNKNLANELEKEIGYYNDKNIDDKNVFNEDVKDDKS